MRYLAIVVLTALQFTAFPFLAILTANTVRQTQDAPHETRVAKQADTMKGTIIYKSVQM